MSSDDANYNTGKLNPGNLGKTVWQHTNPLNIAHLYLQTFLFLIYHFTLHYPSQINYCIY